MTHRTTSLSFIAGAVLALAAGGAGAAGLSHKDSAFLRDAAEAGNAEVEASQLAQTKSTNADVKSFAQTMIDGHDKAGEELKGLAGQKGVKVSDKPSIAQTTEIKLLSARKGSSFDQHYAESVGVKDHEDTVKLFQKEAEQGDDADVKAWAAKTLPTLQHHLEMGQALKAKTDAEPKQ
jgi:putative membrane protein